MSSRKGKNHKALRAPLRADLYYFIWKCFVTIAGGTAYVANWRILAITHQLLRVKNGDVKRLIINQPPRSLKSISTSVAYVAWLLGHDPSLRIIVVSYSSELAEELHRQFRAVVTSEWYQELFPRMRLAKDTGIELVTTCGGGRYATSIGGSLTGRGGDYIVIDDPHKAEAALSNHHCALAVQIDQCRADANKRRMMHGVQRAQAIAAFEAPNCFFVLACSSAGPASLSPCDSVIWIARDPAGLAFCND